MGDCSLVSRPESGIRSPPLLLFTVSFETGPSNPPLATSAVLAGKQASRVCQSPTPSAGKTSPHAVPDF